MNMSDIEKTYPVLSDPALRRMYREDPRGAYQLAREYDESLPELSDDVEVKVVSNTADTFYLLLYPHDMPVSEQQLGQITAGASAGTALTASSVGSAGTACSTVSTASSGGSISTTSSASP